MYFADDIAVDWISSKLYWTESGLQNRIRVLDLLLGHIASVVNLGENVNPRAIVVDPINKWMYWSDIESGHSGGRVKTASMDGENVAILHNTNLQQPYGLTLDYEGQVLYWIDAGLNRIESCGVDGSNRRVVLSEGIYTPLGLTLYNGNLFYTDEGVYMYAVSSSEDYASTVFNSICADTVGIQVVSAERQQSGVNPCRVDNGGCTHLCLLSAAYQVVGYSCACPDGFTLGEDMRTCVLNSSVPTEATIPVLQHGTCVAAGYTGGCCTSGPCRGMPPTCSCDSTCVVFQDCCVDVPPSCQPEIDRLEFVSVTGNVTVVIGEQTQQTSQLHCSVRASRIASFEWTFVSASHLSPSGIHHPTPPLQITNEVGALDARFSVVSSDYSSVLTIEDVQFSDSGNYTCTASIGDRVDPIVGTTVHTVHVFPYSLDIEGSNMYNEGHPLHLRCKVKVFPPASIVWIVGDSSVESRVLRTTSRVSVSATHDIENGEPYSISDFYISNATSEDSRNYTCVIHAASHAVTRVITRNIAIVAINECAQVPTPCLNGATCVDFDVGYWCLCTREFTGDHCTKRMDVGAPLTEPSFINSPPSAITANFGDPVNLTCLARGNPAPSYQWFKDGIRMAGEIRPYLYFFEALPSIRGSYTCQASNSYGSVASDPTHLSVKGVFQYLAVLGHNGSDILSQEAIHQFYINHQSNVYSVMRLETNSSESQLVLTILASQMQSVEERQRELYTSLEGIGQVQSLTRYDGCVLDDHTELDIDEGVTVPCPCNEFLINGDQAWRQCGGSYTSGGQLQPTNFSQCTTVTDDITSVLCSAVMHVQHTPEESALSVLNITHNHQLTSDVDITLLSVLIERLTGEAISNFEIIQHYLKIVDYFQSIDQALLMASQTLMRSSSRVLAYLETFTSRVDIGSRQNLTFTLPSFGIALVDIVASKFQGQTFGVFISSVSSNSNSSTTPERSINIFEGLKYSLNNSLASLHLSERSLSGCLPTDSTRMRLGYFSFFKNSLFLLENQTQYVPPIILGASLNCNVSKLSASIGVSFLRKVVMDDEEHSGQTECASWHTGPWLTDSCRKSLNSSEDWITCECPQFAYFGVLQEQQATFTLRIGIYTYLAIVFSTTFFMLTIINCFAMRKFWSWLQGVVLANIMLTSLMTYIFFVVGAHITSHHAPCIISSALLQVSILALFCWMLVPYVCLCFTLRLVDSDGGKLSRISVRKLKYSCVFLASWLIPVLVTCITIGVWPQYYYTPYFCGVVQWPLWIGMVLPLTTVLVITIALVIGVMFKVTKTSSYHLKRIKESLTALIVVFVTYLTGWIFGLLCVNPHLSEYSNHLQVAFAITLSMEGPVVFIYSIVTNDDTRKFWIKKLRLSHWKNSTAKNSIEPTTMTSSIERDNSSSITDNIMEDKVTKSSRKARKVKKIIPTKTNEAYETVLKRNMKKERYTVTSNEAYAHVSTFV